MDQPRQRGCADRGNETGVDSRAAGQEGDGWDRAAVVGQRGQARIPDVCQVRGGKARGTGRVANQVITQRDEGAIDVGTAAGGGIGGDDGSLRVTVPPDTLYKPPPALAEWL